VIEVKTAFIVIVSLIIVIVVIYQYLLAKEQSRRTDELLDNIDKMFRKEKETTDKKNSNQNE